MTPSGCARHTPCDAAALNFCQESTHDPIRLRPSGCAWTARLTPWGAQAREFRNEGFYERFPAKGQVERVAKIHKELARWTGIPMRGRG